MTRTTRPSTPVLLPSRVGAASRVGVSRPEKSCHQARPNIPHATTTPEHIPGTRGITSAETSAAHPSGMSRAEDVTRGHERSGRGQETTGPNTTRSNQPRVGVSRPEKSCHQARPRIPHATVTRDHTPGTRGITSAATFAAPPSGTWRVEDVTRGHERSGRGQETTTGPNTTSPLRVGVSRPRPEESCHQARPNIPHATVTPNHTPGTHDITPTKTTQEGMTGRRLHAH